MPSPIQTTQQWFKEVVLGLNLCPFAHRPARLNRIHFVDYNGIYETQLMETLIGEIQQLETLDSDQRETTLLIVSKLLGDFYDYQFFLDEANRQLKNHQWLGVYQLASFHPNYCFAGAHPDDDSNLTNRSPYPIIHLLREASLNQVLDQVDKPEDIPQANIERMEELSDEEKQQLFPYIKSQSTNGSND